jgi:hypothetical protein
LSQDKKKTLLEYAKPSQPKKATVDEIVEWFAEEREKKKKGVK